MFKIWCCLIQFTYILSCLLIKPAKIFIFFCLKNWHFNIQVYFGKCMFCCFIAIRVLSYYENDVHIAKISNGNSIYHVLWYHIKYWHTLKEDQVTLDRSPEFLFKTLNLYVSIKNWPCSGEPLMGAIFVPRALFGANLNMIHPLGDIRDLYLLVSNQEILYVSIYKSM